MMSDKMDSILGSFFFCLTSERLVRYKKYARMRVYAHAYALWRNCAIQSSKENWLATAKNKKTKRDYGTI